MCTDVILRMKITQKELKHGIINMYNSKVKLGAWQNLQKCKQWRSYSFVNTKILQDANSLTA